MNRIVLTLLFMIIAAPLSAAHAEEQKEYLYFRDVTIPAFQNMREFFNLPNRPGKYEVRLISDSVGPLTFRIVRAEEDVEKEIKRHRSYKIDDHEFHLSFINPEGKYDLIVEMANSNPISAALVTVIVVEQP